MANIYDVDGNIIAIGGGGSEAEDVEPRKLDIPSIYFVGTLPTAKSDGELLQTVHYISNTMEFECYGTLKAQGNSSLNYPKKNFTLKLFTDQEATTKKKLNFKGWGSQNKFVLKANWVDITHARNIVSARIWGDVVKSRDFWASLPEELKTSPNQGAVDGFPVKVYSNGTYWGRYTLNIPKDKWMTNMDDENDNHCILCSEDYVSGCFRAEALINGNDWTDELRDTVPTSIKTRWNTIISFVRTSSDADFKANIENYFFLDSLIDYYLYAYVSTGLDSLGKNQLYFTYDGVRWIASMYDMEGVWGMYYNGASFVSATYRMQQDYEVGVHNTSNLLFERLESNFGSEIKKRYADLRNTVFSEGHLIERFKDFTCITPQSLIAQDYASATGNGAFTNIPSKTTNTVTKIVENIIARLEYVDGKIEELT